MVHHNNAHLCDVTQEPGRAFTTEVTEATEETDLPFPHLTFPIRERDFFEIGRWSFQGRDKSELLSLP